MKKLGGKVALVTAASRGVGRGIALGLGEAGALIYFTGRTNLEATQPEALLGTLEDTARQIEKLGGKAIFVHCDHSKDEETKHVFDQIEREVGGLDILVNAAWAGYENVFNPNHFTWANKFWEQPVTTWDSMFAVGLQSVYALVLWLPNMRLA